MSKRAIAHLKTDPVMAKLIEQLGPIKLKPRRLSPFQSLVHAIIHQQLSGAAAGTILERFQNLFPKDEFPKPSAVLETPIARLRTAGVSAAKAAYILDIARKTKEGLVPSLEKCDLMTDAELIERLTLIKGVGRWTVEMLLIFNLGRTDILPVDDLGVRKGYQIAYRKRKLPDPDHLKKHGEQWSPYRTAAAWYLWRAADMLNGGVW